MAAVIFQCAEMLAIMYDNLQSTSLARTHEVLFRKMYEENAAFKLRIDDFTLDSDRIYRETTSSEKKDWVRAGQLRDLRRFVRENRKFLEQELYRLLNNFDFLSGVLFLYPVGGVVALALSEIATMPLARITMLFLDGGANGERRSILELTTRIMEQGGGYKELWRGSLAVAAHRLTFYGISCFAYRHYRTLLTGQLSSPHAGAAFLSGGLAALTAASISYPLEILATRIVTRTSKDNKGAWYTFLDICSHDNFDSFLPGMLASLLHFVPSMAISCSLYESLRPHDSTLFVDFACGTLASLAASTATFPFHVVKTRVQLEDGSKGSASVGVGDASEEIIQGEQLYRGYLCHCWKVVIGHTIAFASYEIANLPFALFCAFDQWRSPRKNLFFTERDAVSADISLQSFLSEEFKLKLVFNEGLWFPWSISLKLSPATMKNSSGRTLLRGRNRRYSNKQKHT